MMAVACMILLGLVACGCLAALVLVVRKLPPSNADWASTLAQNYLAARDLGFAQGRAERNEQRPQMSPESIGPDHSPDEPLAEDLMNPDETEIRAIN